MKEIRIRVTLINDMLGTMAGDPEIYSEFIASKAPNATTRKEEIEAIGVEAAIEKGMTVFPKFADGTPFMYDYQMRGFFKDACSALQRMKGEDMSKESCGLKAYKKVIDGCVFVEPREIPIDFHGGLMDVCERPLRGQTAQGERTALACSEAVPEGSTMEMTIICADVHEKLVKEWLNYGRYKGLLQWRNSGKGRFVWEHLDEAGNVIGGNKAEAW